MLLSFLALLLSSIGWIDAWDILNDYYDDEYYYDDYDVPFDEGTGISEVGAKERFRERFPSELEITCKYMHETVLVPFVATILYKTSGHLLCMGTIVDSCHILTAKRCYDRADVSDLLVLVGYYKAYWGRYSQVVPVKRIVRNEYEIALLRLGKNLRFTPFVQAVKLPTAFSKLFIFKKRYPPPYKTVGFPVDRYEVPGDAIAKDKLYTITDEGDVDFEVCKKNFSKMTLDETKLFCTVPNGSTKALCWGGWGGPVLKPMSKGFLLQVGVVIADNCSEETTGPLLVVRTDVFGDWIRGNSFHGHQAT